MELLLIILLNVFSITTEDFERLNANEQETLLNQAVTYEANWEEIEKD
jgi:hypothetical protein